jgi:lipopolysaccharide biosynthesis glycosyltransferase
MTSRLVYTAADSNYLLQAKVFLRSMSYTQIEPTHLLVFGSGWNQTQRDELAAHAFNHLSVEVRDVDPEKHRDIRLTNGFPLATAYNILAPQNELPVGVRAAYFDADMVVRRDLGELFAMPMKYAVGSVIDAHVAMVGGPSMWRPWREEKIDPRLPYLNTGALLIDVDRWNSERLTQRTLEFLEKYDLPCVDQDAINLALRGEFDLLRPAFNSMPYHIMKLLRTVDLVESLEDIEEAITDPVVVHFHRSFLGKPWTYGSTHPARKLWTNLADECDSQWRKKLDLMSWARGFAANKAKMSILDDRASKMTKLNVVKVKG